MEKYTEMQLKTDEKLMRQNVAALRLLGKVTAHIRKKYGMLLPAIQIFENTAVKDDILLETDGVHLYYNPEKTAALLAAKKAETVEYQYMHILLHGVLGHFISEGDVNDTYLEDACMDNAVKTLMLGINYGDTRKNGIMYIFLGMEWKEIYFRAREDKQKKDTLFQQYSEYNADDHALWHDRNGKADGESKGKGKADAAAGNEAGTDGKAAGAAEKWRQALNSMGIAESDINGIVSSISSNNLTGEFGRQAGGYEKLTKASDAKGNSYAAVIKQFFHTKEAFKEQEGSIERMLYAYSEDLYGDVRLVEPEENADIRQLNTIVIAIDTSGSCSGEISERFLKETGNILRDITAQGNFKSIYVMQCDASIQHEECYKDVRSINKLSGGKKLSGFGGTDFRPVFERTEELIKVKHIEVDCLLYLSDGFGSFPDRRSSFKTFFIMPSETRPDSIPDWIETIELKEDKQCIQ